MTAPRLTDGELIEDLTFMADAHEGLRSAAKRTGYTTDALERHLYRLNQHGLVARLRTFDPAPVNTTQVADGRYAKWKRTPLGRRTMDDAGKWLDLTATSWPEEQRAQERRRVDLILETDRKVRAA